MWIIEKSINGEWVPLLDKVNQEPIQFGRRVIATGVAERYAAESLVPHRAREIKVYGHYEIHLEDYDDSWTVLHVDASNQETTVGSGIEMTPLMSLERAVDALKRELLKAPKV